jgi:hypothetical protein
MEFNSENNQENAANEGEQSFSVLAVAKIAQELDDFHGGSKEKTVSKFVASTLTHFCEANERFAEVVYKTQRTLSDCCAEVMDGCGNQISDIDVYRAAVQSYFPNADIFFKMEIQLTGNAPDAEELNRSPKKDVVSRERNTVIQPRQDNRVANQSRSPDIRQSKESIQISLFD